jgi:hypothetical protein
MAEKPIPWQWRSKMLLIVMGISVCAAISGVLFITHFKFAAKKDYLYDETDAFDQRQIKRWRM